MDDAAPKTWKLNIRLLKQDATAEQSVAGDRLTRFDWPNVPGAALYVGTAYHTDPKWKQFLGQAVEGLPKLKNRAAAAIVAVPVRERTMLVSFGASQHLIEEDDVERDFGLKAVLNCVDDGNLRSIDIKTPEDLSSQRRVQTSYETNSVSFGVDVERDILRAVTGRPTDPSLGQRITGADSLTVACRLRAQDLLPLCDKILGIYESEQYRHKGFDWVDHIRPVRSGELTDQLDTQLVAALQLAVDGQDASHMHLVPPVMIDHETTGSVRYKLAL